MVAPLTLAHYSHIVSHHIQTGMIQQPRHGPKTTLRASRVGVVRDVHPLCPLSQPRSDEHRAAQP